MAAAIDYSVVRSQMVADIDQSAKNNNNTARSSSVSCCVSSQSRQTHTHTRSSPSLSSTLILKNFMISLSIAFVFIQHITMSRASANRLHSWKMQKVFSNQWTRIEMDGTLFRLSVYFFVFFFIVRIGFALFWLHTKAATTKNSNWNFHKCVNVNMKCVSSLCKQRFAPMWRSAAPHHPPPLRHNSVHFVMNVMYTMRTE